TRTEHETEQDRRGVEVEPQQDVADNTDEQGLTDLEHVVIGGIDPDADEEHRARIEVAIGDAQHLHPQADHGHVEDDEQDVADPEARDQAPEDVGMLADQLRSGYDAMDDQRAEQERHHRVAGNAEAHGWDEVALHRGVGRGFGAGDTFDGA